MSSGARNWLTCAPEKGVSEVPPACSAPKPSFSRRRERALGVAGYARRGRTAGGRESAGRAAAAARAAVDSGRRDARRRARRDLQGVPRRAGLAQRVSVVLRAEARRAEPRVHRDRAAGISARHAQPSDDAGAGVVALRPRHRGPRGFLLRLGPASPRPGSRTRARTRSTRASRRRPACQQCHGEAGVAAAKQWPNLAGQHLSYLEQALNQYKSGQRNDLLMAPAGRGARRGDDRGARGVLLRAALPAPDADRLARRR